jgi:phage gp29-like protein
VFGYNAALTPFSKYPGKFLTAVFRTKAGSIGEAAQLRTLAPLWLGSMLGWEWLVQKAELFGTPLRWANYPTNATQLEIDAITEALINMGTASWGAFPTGTNLQLFHGSVPGVAGPNDPSERLMAMADRACDIMFLGQNLAVEGSGATGKAATQVHREVELDLFESYADFIADIINTQLIPELIGLNWGNKDELPFVQVELPRPKQEQELADRDKTLFLEMGLPVSLQYLYERHKIPTPDADAELFVPVSPFGIPTAKPADPAAPAPDPAAPTAAKGCGCGCAAPSTALSASSESGQSFAERAAKAYATFSGEVLQAEANGEYLVWDATLDAVTTALCQGRHGRRWGDGWLTPPPAHFNCRSVLIHVPKADYKAPS